MIHAAVGEAITDALVVLKKVRRKAPRRSPVGRREGLTGAALEGALDGWAVKFPDQVH